MEQLLQEMRAGSPTCRRGEGFADNLDISDGRIRGRAVPFGYTVELRPGLWERFERGAFTSQLKDPGRVKVCIEHGQVVGSASGLEERGDGLWFVGGISGNPAITEAGRARALLDEGLVDELSIGFRTVPGGTDVEQVDGGVLWRHRRAQLMEVSLVPWGVYGREATLARSRLIDPAAELVAARRAQMRAWFADWRTLRV